MKEQIETNNDSENMYSYVKKDPKGSSNAIARSSLGKKQNIDQDIDNHTDNPINNNINNKSLQDDRDSIVDTVTIHIDQSPPLFWMFFIVFGIIQIVILVFICFYYNWYDFYTNPKSIFNKDPDISYNDLDSYLSKGNNEKSKLKGWDVYNTIENKFKLFQEVNIMIFLGFGFLRSFLKHYSWTSIALTLMAGVLSTEFGLFMLICWSAIFSTEWTTGNFNFQHLLDANICAGSVIISLGTLLGKISMPQYIILILTETMSSTLNYCLLRQILHIIDVGGTLTMHLFGALFGGIFSFISFFSKNERERIRDSKHLGSNYYSIIFSIFGSLILISYWPSFNTCLIDDKLRRPNDNGNYKPKYDGIINTYFAVIGSIISTFFTSPIFNEGKLDIQDILNSCFSGGIAIGGCCHLIDHYWLSILIGLFTGVVTTVVSNLISQRFKFNGYHDTANALFYHGVPGFIGGIFTTIFVGNLPRLIKYSDAGVWSDKLKIKNYIYKYVGTLLDYYNDERDFGEDNNFSFGKYAGIHFAAIFITIVVSLGCGFIAGFSIKFCNCNIAMRYFNDSEFFDVSEGEHFPWKDENIKLELEYNPKNL